MSRRKRLFILGVLLPIAIALHVWLIRLGGAARVLAIAELVVGAFVVLAMRESKRLGGG